jgi:predicted dehydrogenase
MKTVRWGILSTARINRRIIPEIRAAEGSELVAVASRSLEAAKDYAAQWEIPVAYGSYEELLDDRSIDVIYISVPNDLHALWTIRALLAGKHVLCEKPLCLTSLEMQEIIRVSKETGFTVMEAFMYMHHPQTEFFKTIAHQEIGQIIALNSEFTATFSRSLDNYRMDADKGGGALWDIGVYPVSFFRHLISNEVVAVSAKARIQNGVDTSFWGRIDFERDISAQFVASFESVYSTRTSIMGTEGRLDLTHPYNATDECRAFLTRGEEMTELSLPKKPLYAGEIENMNAIARNEEKPVFSLNDSEEVLDLILQLRESAQLMR